MQPGRGRVGPAGGASAELHPPVVINRAPRLSIAQINTDLNGAQQFPAGDPTRAAHAASEDREFDGDGGFGGDAAEGVGVEVECGGGSGGLGWV